MKNARNFIFYYRFYWRIATKKQAVNKFSKTTKSDRGVGFYILCGRIKIYLCRFKVEENRPTTLFVVHDR